MRRRLWSGQAEIPAADQAEVIGFLSDPASHAGSDRVERVETHGNLVFLSGSEAWKIKRAVRFPYMDFSTLEKRRAACEREVAINRRFSADLYLGCVPITRSTGGVLAFAGDGESSNGPFTCGVSSNRRCSAPLRLNGPDTGRPREKPGRCRL